MNNTAIKLAPAESGEKRLEVEVHDGEARIRLSTFVTGLGWCGEKTMSVDGDLLDEMHRLISAARVRLRAAAAETEAGATTGPRILNFPSVA